MSDWEPGQPWPWTEAGIRRDPRQRARALSRVLTDKNRSATREATARRLWAAGRVSPWRITYALDSAGLEGPEVDIACGAQEPDVDLWEAGARYPTWEQLTALAALCGVSPLILCDDGRPDVDVITASSMRFHGYPDTPPLVHRFAPEAIRETLAR